jgi:hypothetical protein
MSRSSSPLNIVCSMAQKGSSVSLDPSHTGVYVTSREIYDAVVRLTGRVDVLIEQHSAHSADLQDHESRIRVLEKARWPLPMFSLVIGLLGIAYTYFGK